MYARTPARLRRSTHIADKISRQPSAPRFLAPIGSKVTVEIPEHALEAYYERCMKNGENTHIDVRDLVERVKDVAFIKEDRWDPRGSGRVRRYLWTQVKNGSWHTLRVVIDFMDEFGETPGHLIIITVVDET